MFPRRPIIPPFNFSLRLRLGGFRKFEVLFPYIRFPLRSKLLVSCDHGFEVFSVVPPSRYLSFRFLVRRCGRSDLDFGEVTLRELRERRFSGFQSRLW